jgi:hypothetical protein
MVRLWAQLMQDGKPEHRELIRASVRADDFGGAFRERILDLVQEYGTADRVLEKASEYASVAKSCLASFPASEARSALAAIPEYIVERDLNPYFSEHLKEPTMTPLRQRMIEDMRVRNLSSKTKFGNPRLNHRRNACIRIWIRRTSWFVCFCPPQ